MITSEERGNERRTKNIALRVKLIPKSFKSILK